jgi:hypothetical protein
LVDLLLRAEVTQPVRSEIDEAHAFGQLLCDESSGQTAAQDLPAVGDRHNAGRSIYRCTEIVPTAYVSFSGVEAHSDSNRFFGRPPFRAQLHLSFSSCCQSGEGTREHGGHTVTHGGEHSPPGVRDGRLQDRVMLGDGGSHRRLVQLPEPR